MNSILHTLILKQVNSTLQYMLNNFIESYPNSSFLEEVFYCQTKSYFELAKNSIEEKKDLRTKEFIFAFQDFSLTYPNSKYLIELKK